MTQTPESRDYNKQTLDALICNIIVIALGLFLSCRAHTLTPLAAIGIGLLVTGLMVAWLYFSRPLSRYLPDVFRGALHFLLHPWTRHTAAWLALFGYLARVHALNPNLIYLLLALYLLTTPSRVRG